MPYASPRPCTHPACGVLVKEGRCDKHRHQKNKEQKDRQYDGPRPYDKQSWRRLRRYVLRRQRVCECGRWTTDVDHKDGDPYNNSMDNLRAMCHSCHSKKTVREDGGFTGKR